MAYFIAGQHHDYLAFLARDFGAFFGAVFFSLLFAISFNILSRKKQIEEPMMLIFFFNTSPDYDKELLPGLLDSTLWVRKACLHGIFPGLAGFA